MSDDQQLPKTETLAEIERLCELLEPIDVRAGTVRAAARATTNERTAHRILQAARVWLAEQGIKE